MPMKRSGGVFERGSIACPVDEAAVTTSGLSRAAMMPAIRVSAAA
jgi:hypothetical protein